MSYPVEAAGERIGLQGYPRARDFLERIRARPAFQRAEQRGGTFGVPGG